MSQAFQADMTSLQKLVTLILITLLISKSDVEGQSCWVIKSWQFTSLRLIIF